MDKKRMSKQIQKLFIAENLSNWYGTRIFYIKNNLLLRL
jgi:hypothetical protein